jgi:hypothetical protein
MVDTCQQGRSIGVGPNALFCAKRYVRREAARTDAVILLFE